MASIVVNADDFGLDERTNLAIVEAYQKKLISHTTMLANMDGFEHALKLISNSQIDKKDIGVHINLTQGRPLTEGISKDSFFCINGKFHGNIRRKPIFFLNADRSRLVSNEIIAQIDRLSKYGIVVRHLDGHHHIHTEWAIFKSIEKIIKYRGIRSVRISRTEFAFKYSLRKLLVKFYKSLFNFYIRRQDFITTKYMGEITDYQNISSKNTRSIEIMTHLIPTNIAPRFDDLEYAVFSDKLNRLKTDHSIISFDDLK